MTIEARLQEALRAHQQGDLERARSGYVGILKHQPKHSQALHLLGVCAFQAGFADEAITHINLAIAESPGVADFHNNLGEVYRQCGRPIEAENAYRQALELTPDYGDAHNNLALVLQTRGLLNEAIEHLRTAQKIEPRDPQTAANLANVLRLAGDFTGAQDSFQQALELAPNFSEARLALCQMLIEQEHISDASSLAEEGLRLNAQDPAALCASACVALSMAQYTQATQQVRAIVKLKPQSAPVQMTLGRLFMQLGENQSALQWLERASEQIPAQTQLQFLLSKLYLELNRLDSAQEAILKALDFAPDDCDFQIQCARVYRYQDRLAEAVDYLETVLTNQPTNLHATLERTEVHLLMGESDRAQELLEQALSREPDHHALREQLASVLLSSGQIQASINHLSQIIVTNPERISSYALLSQTRKFKDSDELLLASLSKQLDSIELTPRQGIIGNFALGKMLADCGRYSKAFEKFQLANTLKRKQVDYAPGVHQDFVQERIQAFNQARIQRLTTYGNPSQLPIFIAGMPRSGTTLVERILASHSHVAAGGEINVLTRITPRPMGDVPTQNYLGLALDSLDVTAVERLSQDSMSRLCRDHTDAIRITEKTPQNFLHLGMASILFPNAPIIHCYRHPMATCMSIYSMEMNLGNEFAYQLDELAHYYSQYQLIMDHWHKVMPGQIFNLSYERLVDDFEIVCRELLEFCGLEWDPRCLDFHTTTGAVLTASDWQVRQPLYRGAVDAWRHYQSELEPLRQALEELGVTLE